MKLLQILVTAGFVAGAAAVVGSSPAASDPAGCTKSVQLLDVSASCSGGTGQIKVSAQCFGVHTDANNGAGLIPFFGNYTAPVVGTAGVGGRATASCHYYTSLGIATGAELTCYRPATIDPAVGYPDYPKPVACRP